MVLNFWQTGLCWIKIWLIWHVEDNRNIKLIKLHDDLFRLMDSKIISKYGNRFMLVLNIQSVKIINELFMIYRFRKYAVKLKALLERYSKDQCIYRLVNWALWNTMWTFERRIVVGLYCSGRKNALIKINYSHLLLFKALYFSNYIKTPLFIFFFFVRIN